MQPSNRYVLIFTVLFLFLLQSIGTLVESIYILDLLKTSLDEKALGLLFLFSPLFLLFLRRKPSPRWIWIVFAVLFVGRGVMPFLPTAARLLASGFAAAAGLLLLPILINTQLGGERPSGRALSLGLALAVGVSVFLRAVGVGFDVSLQSEGGWLGWLLGLSLAMGLRGCSWIDFQEETTSAKEALLPTIGIFMGFGLVYFAFSAPSVMARWVESDYPLTVFLVSLFSLAWVMVLILRPSWISGLSLTLVALWNGLFTLAMTATLLANRVPFPASPDSPPVIVGAPSWGQQVPFYLMLLLFPVIFLDLYLLTDQWSRKPASLPALAAGMLVGILGLILLVFMHIFTNVWGYVQPVSLWFRNQFWLPYFLMGTLLTLTVVLHRRQQRGLPPSLGADFSAVWLIFLAGLSAASLLAAYATTQVRSFQPRPNSLVVMTYNIQQANDIYCERSYQRQLAIMKQVDADVIALQESDSARVSLNNADVVRYFAGKLGYYAFYGPSPLTGTYGMAILSKYPLRNPHVVFSFSDQDEIGTAVAEIEIDGKVFTIYNVHPDGSETAMLVFAQTLLDQIGDKAYVIALGDYNLRDDEAAYQLIASRLTNVWESLYPTKISPQGIDMSGRNRIDHIFLSTPLKPCWATYVLPPDSATDHPLHWAEIFWEE